MDAMTAEYWPISTVLTTDCMQNDLHLCYIEAVKFRGLWFVKKDMTTDRQKKMRIELNVKEISCNAFSNSSKMLDFYDFHISKIHKNLKRISNILVSMIFILKIGSSTIESYWIILPPNLIWQVS